LLGRRREVRTMRTFRHGALLVLGGMLIAAIPTQAADDSKVKGATQQVESGARKVGQGEVGKGVEETAKGIGNTVVEGAKFTGEKFKEAGKAAEPPAKRTGENIKEGARSFGQTVKGFFTRLFNN
jgi:hypothetical protein